MKRKKFFWPAVVVLGWCIAFIIAATWPLWSWAAADGKTIGSDGVAITFFPVDVKSRQLVAVELVSSDQHTRYYKAIEGAVFKNDWRPQWYKNGDQTNPGKCTVIVLPDGYDVDCWLLRPNAKAITWHSTKVKTTDEVIVMVKDFSKLRSKQ